MSDTIISSVIICPKCKYTNPSKSKFCMQCGSPLEDSVKTAKSMKLVLVGSKKEMQEFPIEKKTSLGKGADISLKGADFSNNICEISPHGDMLSLKVLEDGVFIKVKIGENLELAPGSELRIGDKLFRVET